MGPLGGIVAALSDTRAEWNLVAACDMPGLEQSVARPTACRKPESDVTVPVTADGRTSPSLRRLSFDGRCPLFRTRWMPGIRTATDVVRRLRCRTIVVEDEALVANVNTPATGPAFAQGQE